MSRIGNRPIEILDQVLVEITASSVAVSFSGKKMELPIPECITVKMEDNKVVVNRKDDSKESRSYHGLITRLIGNMIKGVKEGFTRELEFMGTGYRVAVAGNEVLLNMGYSHEVKIEIPQGLSVDVKKNTITVSGHDKQAVGQLAAIIRNVRKPEVYKGKGIRYKEEIIKKKAGKKAAS